jgi:hypothetical protein
MRRAVSAIVACVIMGSTHHSVAQDYGTRLGVRRGGEVHFEPQGPGILFDALDPAVRKWYVPQELYNEYRWQQWDYTNYARDRYQNYVETALEGNYFYDLYGGFVTKGWLVFDWSVTEPVARGNRLLKTERFGAFFNRLVISADSRGQYYWSTTVGRQIRTTLTPLTFSKPVFDGIQFDFASDKYAATFLTSRPSGFQTGMEAANERTNVTNLMGGRATAQVGDFVTVGGTYVNLFHAGTRGQAMSGNPFKGTLTEAQNNTITRIDIRLSDDSPEDNQDGAAFYLEEMIITSTTGERLSNRRVLKNGDGTTSIVLGYHPEVEGGYQRGGHRTADGSEVITLVYDFSSLEYEEAFGPPPTEIEKVEFRLLLSNDYRIDVTSDRQTNEAGQAVYLSDGIPERTVRSPGNVRDGSNQGFVTVEYGLPTASEIYGFTLEVEDIMGLNLQAEFDRSRQHTRYPRAGEPKGHRHAAMVRSADAWTVSLTRPAGPIFLLAEAYRMDPDYSTSGYIAQERGDDGPIDYDASLTSVYELVDDNDDQDRYPDWQRRGVSTTADRFVFPGWDENNDFIADFNQNNNEDIRPNLLPDWEEPFLRYHVDRPEFLFGVDMNNNGIVDRFENDAYPDYPYRRDRMGYNVYAGAYLSPGLRLTVGRTDERQLAEARDNITSYLLLTYDQDFPRLGRVRLYENLRRSKDEIKDDVLLWSITDGIAGEILPHEDPLPGRNTWINTLYLGWDHGSNRDLRVISKFKYEFYHQVDFSEAQIGASIRPGEDIRGTSSFLGIINKAEYTYRLGNLTLLPRWKSEFERRMPHLRFDRNDPPSTALRELASLTVSASLLTRTTVQAGLEYLWVKQFRESARNTLAGSGRKELVTALQVSLASPYLGYEVHTHFGVRLSRFRLSFLDETETSTFMFFTMYAGFGQ